MSSIDRLAWKKFLSLISMLLLCGSGFSCGCSCSKDDPAYDVLQNIFDPNNSQATNPGDTELVEDPAFNESQDESDEEDQPLDPDPAAQDQAEIDNNPDRRKAGDAQTPLPQNENNRQKENDDQQGEDDSTDIDFGSIDVTSISDPQQAAEIARHLMQQARTLRDDGNATEAYNKAVDVLDLIYPHATKSAECEQLKQEAQTLAQSLDGLINQPAPDPGVPIKIR